MLGTIAVTDQGWYEFLLQRPELQEVDFWRPSARRRFVAPEFSPFLFKLRAPHNAICGFGYLATWSPLPIWLAWETFGEGNGCATLAEMRARLESIRARIRYRPGPDSGLIGCTLIVQPVFFPRDAWIPQPDDWRARTQTDRKYDLTTGEGRRVWEACLAVARELAATTSPGSRYVVADPRPRYGAPVVVRPRLGQRTFRIVVTDAYERACAVTGEHSLPALDAAHILPFSDGGPYATSNGILLRADLHRLFDKGYVTITPDHRIEVSGRLREEYQNGRTYYPLQGERLRLPHRERDRPDPELLRWHNENVFAA
ncbi:MAG TPA: HNH endonuclease [Longimicrobiales bacterium]